MREFYGVCLDDGTTTECLAESDSMLETIQAWKAIKTEHPEVFITIYRRGDDGMATAIYDFIPT